MCPSITTPWNIQPATSNLTQPRQNKSFHLFPSLQLRSAISYTKTFSGPSIPAPISFQEVMYFTREKTLTTKVSIQCLLMANVLTNLTLANTTATLLLNSGFPAFHNPFSTSLSYIWFARARVRVCILFSILHIETGSFDFTQRLLIQLV